VILNELEEQQTIEPQRVIDELLDIKL